jgi:hypothetical protein
MLMNQQKQVKTLKQRSRAKKSPSQNTIDTTAKPRIVSSLASNQTRLLRVGKSNEKDQKVPGNEQI